MSTILVVEDEPKLAALMADYLKASGFAAHCIADGLEVVPWVREHWRSAASCAASATSR